MMYHDLQSIAARLRALNPEDLRILGWKNTVFIRKITTEDGVAYVMFGTDGTPLGGFLSLEVAQASAIQNEMEPLSVH